MRKQLTYLVANAQETNVSGYTDAGKVGVDGRKRMRSWTIRHLFGPQQLFQYARQLPGSSIRYVRNGQRIASA
eukprot:2866838-Rhodomonas_salina.1